VNTIPGIEEVNIFLDETVIHFVNPKGNMASVLLSLYRYHKVHRQMPCSYTLSSCTRLKLLRCKSLHPTLPSPNSFFLHSLMHKVKLLHMDLGDIVALLQLVVRCKSLHPTLPSPNSFFLHSLMHKVKLLHMDLGDIVALLQLVVRCNK